MIARSRREGKNRRDGATVATRVMTLTDTVGQALFAAASGDSRMSEEDKKMLKQQQARRRAIKTRAHL